VELLTRGNSMVFLLLVVAVVIMSSSNFSVDAFKIIQQYDSTTLFRPNHLRLSRRDVLVTTITTTSSVLLTQPVQAKDESMNYQAVWYDPKHPSGYRVLFGDDQKATLLLRDDPSGDELAFPVYVIKKEGKEIKLLFDFGKNKARSSDDKAELVEGIFTKNSDKIRIISFDNNDGKNNWMNKKFEGPIGVYKDSMNSKRVIIIRQIKGSDCVVEFRDNGGNNVTSTFTARAGSTFTFNVPDRGEVTALFSFFRRTLTFGDGTVWTKY